VGLRLVVAEVAARDGGHAGLVEEAAGEAHAVAVEAVGAGIDVEGAHGASPARRTRRPAGPPREGRAGRRRPAGAARRRPTTSGVKAASPPYWAGAGGAMKAFWANASTAGSAHAGQTIHPSRQPVIPNVLEKLLITNGVSVSARTVAGSRS